MAAGGGYVAPAQHRAFALGLAGHRRTVAPVEVVRDREGVPHIFAKSDRGPLHARSASSTRRIACGRWSCSGAPAKGGLSEIFGERTFTTDVFLRTLDLYGHAERSLAALPLQAKNALEAYARGVNAFIERSVGWLEPRLPPEFLLLAASAGALAACRQHRHRSS